MLKWGPRSSPPRLSLPLSVPLPFLALLGVVQGLTETLPLSADGHLALVELLYGRTAPLALVVALRLGTIAAMVVVLADPGLQAVRDGFRGLVRPAAWKETQGGRDAFAVVLATVPAGIVGFGVRHLVESWSGTATSPGVIGAGFLASAAILASTMWARPGERDAPTHLGAILVGVAQGAAAVPGLSRTAVMLSALLWLGVKPQRAFALAFLMAWPAIAGAIVLEGRHAIHGGEDWVAIVVGMIVAGGVGIAGLRALRTALEKRLLPAFALYLVPVGVAALAWSYARP